MCRHAKNSFNGGPQRSEGNTMSIASLASSQARRAPPAIPIARPPSPEIHRIRRLSSERDESEQKGAYL